MNTSQSSSDNREDKPEPPQVDFSKPVPPRPQKRVRNRNDSPWSAVAMITQLGLVVSFCIVGSVMAGAYIDRLVGSNGVFILGMIPVGLGAAAVAAWQIIKQELP